CLFFFQAEDGIRDRNVTGVQTCALPIWEISPFGPFTVTVRPATCAVTPWGSGTGFLPMRDMPLPDHREQLAAHAGGTGFAVRHQALGRREDGHPEPVLHARDLARLDVAPQPRG